MYVCMYVYVYISMYKYVLYLILFVILYIHKSKLFENIQQAPILTSYFQLVRDWNS